MMPPKKNGLLHSLVDNGRMYLRLLLRRETPWHIKAILVGALVYLVVPFDLIPDWLLGVGILDDFAVVSALVGLAVRMLNKEIDKLDRES